MQIMYNYITYCIGNILHIWLSIYNRTVLVSYSNLTCTFASTQVNATDIAEHYDTMCLAGAVANVADSDRCRCNPKVPSSIPADGKDFP